MKIGPYYLPHAANVDFMVKWTLENRSDNPGIEPDDMFLCNDCWVGALHPQDVAVFSPVFVDGQLFAWTGSTIHQVDIGGVNIGSWCVDADDHFAEGMTYPPIKIVERGTIRKDIEEVYLRRSRAPKLIALDLRAHIASNNVAKQRLLALVDRYGAQTIHSAMKKQMDYAEQRFRERLRKIPDGVWRCETYQEACKTGDRGVYKTLLTMRKTADRLQFDFSGSDPNAGMINCTRAGAVGGSIVAILPQLCLRHTLGRRRPPPRARIRDAGGHGDECRIPARRVHGLDLGHVGSHQQGQHLHRQHAVEHARVPGPASRRLHWLVVDRDRVPDSTTTSCLS